MNKGHKKVKKPEEVCNEHVFEGLFKSLAPALRNFLYYKFKNLERADDIVQEAFAALWKACKNVTKDKAKSFLFKVAQNQFLKSSTKEKRYAHDLQLETAEVEDPAFTLEHKELSEKLKMAIDQLPEGQREVFLMNRLDGLSYKEIAAYLEISVKAVEKRMHKALLKLREVCKKL